MEGLLNPAKQVETKEHRRFWQFLLIVLGVSSVLWLSLFSSTSIYVTIEVGANKAKEPGNNQGVGLPPNKTSTEGVSGIIEQGRSAPAPDLHKAPSTIPAAPRSGNVTSSAPKVPKGFFNSQPISFTHIPKCAGTSFIQEFRPRWSQQNCYETMKVKKAFNAVLFRSPRSHVQSQFIYCKYSKWGQRQIKGRGYPDSGDDDTDFNAWLDHFLLLEPDNTGASVDYNCIDPRNVQARHMSCHNEKNPRANHYLKYPPDLDKAMSYLEDATMVGFADFYHESKCLVRFRQSPTHKLPADCRCDATENSLSKEVHASHGVPKHEAVFTKEVQEKIDALTDLDGPLFVAALKRFLKDVDVAERVAGRKFFCDRSKADNLLQEYSF